MKFKWLLATALFVCASAPLANAQAGCWGYYENESSCSGTGGCSSSYVWSICSFGCVSGDCFNHSGSGLCCNHLYYTASIRTNGGTCSGDNCSLARVHHGRPLASNMPDKAIPTALSPPRTNQLVKVALVPDRCRGIYAVIEEEYPQPATKAVQLAVGGF